MVWFVHAFDICGNLIDGVAGVLELVVELLVVVAQPQLEALQEVSGEVSGVVVVVAVLTDLAQLCDEDALVVLGCGFEGVFIEPCRRPGESVQEHGFVALILGIIFCVEVRTDVFEYVVQFIVCGCFRVLAHRIVVSSEVA